MDVKRYEANYIPYEGLDLSGACAEMHGRFFVHMEDFDRVTAERDALQLRLNAVEEENDCFRMAARDALQVINWQIFGIAPDDGRSAPSSRDTRALLATVLEKRP